MATTGWRKNTAVAHQLQKTPARFEFFQAVRLLELTAQWYARQGKKFAKVPVAKSAPPNRESIRFSAQASVAFKGADLEKIAPVTTVETDDESAPQTQWQVLVNIFGLFGSTGVLPFHISELIIKRLRQKDHSLRAFLDVLNHRSTSLYYQAWHKYRLPVAYERSKSTKSDQDLFSNALAALVGLATPGVNNRMAVPDEAIIGFSGQLAGSTPSAPSLARMLQHYFELPVEVEQFIAQWQSLPQDIQSRLPNQAQNNILGRNVILGRQCWELQSKFRIKINDINYEQFIGISPNSSKMAALKAFVRFVVGTEYDFDIEISIHPDQIPEVGLGAVATIGGKPVQGGELMLGWSTNLRKQLVNSDDQQRIRILVSSKNY